MSKPRFKALEQSLAWHMATKRELLGFTQEQMCRNVGIGRAAYSAYELGKKLPSLRMFKTICDRMYIDPKQVIQDTEWTL